MNSKGIYSKLLFALIIMALLISSAPAALADDFNFDTSHPSSYFEKAINNGALGLIPTASLGSHSIGGSVMPNWKGWSTSSGGGAVGADALKEAFSKAGRGVLNTDDTVSANQKNLKQALYDLLYQRNTSGGKDGAGVEWDRTGSAVVVYTMLGKAWGSGTRTPTPDDWTDLKNRLVNNDDITMRRQDYTNAVNTAGVLVHSAIYDAAPFKVEDVVVDMDSWVLMNKVNDTNKLVYALEIICANPLGKLVGLPVPPVKNDKYDLKPTVRLDSATAVEPGSSIPVMNTVKNEGVDPSGLTTWRLTQMVYQPGSPATLNGMKVSDSTSDPCGSFPSAARKNCDTVREKTDQVFAPGPEVPFDPAFTYTVPSDTSVGTRICFTVSVKPPTQDAPTNWRHSTLQCVIVAKSPKLQVWGGDVRAGGSINTSISTLEGLTYGSWGEYAALSGSIGKVPPLGTNNGFGSGNGLNGGNGNSTQSGWSSLTFANKDTCNFGCYNFTLTSSTLADQFGSGDPALPGGNMNSWPSGTYKTGDLSLGNITLNNGKSIVILSSGTVTISGDIAYNDGTYTSIRDIPQLVIKAPKINIQAGVGRVDAWLIAVAGGEGTLNTCSTDKDGKLLAPDAQLAADVCKDPLVVHGPVVADKIYLRRTAGSQGSEASRGDPAEIFDLRADAYLWGNAYANGKNKVRTVYTKELPPRF